MGLRWAQSSPSTGTLSTFSKLGLNSYDRDQSRLPLQLNRTLSLNRQTRSNDGGRRTSPPDEDCHRCSSTDQRDLHRKGLDQIISVSQDCHQCCPDEHDFDSSLKRQTSFAQFKHAIADYDEIFVVFDAPRLQMIVPERP